MTLFGPYGHHVSLGVVTLLPLAALFGNAPADIALVLTILVYLLTEQDAVRNLYRSRIIQIAFLFWIWILICSALSIFPKHSFQDSLPWIRFPIFAFVLSEFLTKTNKNYSLAFYSSAIIGTIIEVGAMIYQFINRRLFVYQLQEIDVRLTGTFAKQMAGWYIISFSLLSILLLIQAIRDGRLSNNKKILVGIFTILSTIGIVISGEIYNTILFFVTLIGFFILQHPKEFKKDRTIAIAVAAILFICVTILFFDENLYARIVHGLTKRLPWLPTSDYYTIWSYALDVAKHNFIHGVGPKNTFNYCMDLKNNNLIGSVTDVQITNCPWHPHNLYIQILSETGIIGLVLFSGFAAYIVYNSIKAFIQSQYKNNIALVLSIVLLVPIQTYSQAFGQSRNFYFWVVLGVILQGIKKFSNTKEPNRPNQLS